MNMTHYMELLSVNQPWNLLMFMGGPVVLAETIAITELYLLYTRNYKSRVRSLNRFCSVIMGLYFSVVIRLFDGRRRLATDGGWRMARTGGRHRGRLLSLRHRAAARADFGRSAADRGQAGRAWAHGDPRKLRGAVPDRRSRRDGVRHARPDGPDERRGHAHALRPWSRVQKR